LAGRYWGWLSKDKYKKKYSHFDLKINDDLGVLAGTKTRVCKCEDLFLRSDGRWHVGKNSHSLMYWWDDGKLVVRDWVKGEEN
jgi:hypothetical protein